MTRIAALSAALCGVAVAFAAPASADHDSTCHPPRGNVFGVWLTVGSFEVQKSSLRLGFSIDATGDVRPFGSVLLAGKRLLPEAAGSSAQCADANGNGDAGLTEARIVLRDVRTGERARAVLTPETEIDASGRYSGVIEICDAARCIPLEGVAEIFFVEVAGGGSAE